MASRGEPLVRTIAGLAFPALGGLAAEPLYLLFDMAVVGRLGALSLAGLAVGGLVVTMLSSQLTFLSYGTTARAARFHGAGDRAAAAHEGVQATWLALGLGVLIVVAVQVVAGPLTKVVAGDAAIADAAVRGVRLRGAAALAAHQVVLQMWTFLALVLDSLAIAAQSLVGAALGAGEPTHAKRMAWRVTGYSALAALLLDGVLLGAGDAAFMRTATVLSALSGFLPLIWLSLVFDWGLAGIWAGLSAFIVLRLLFGRLAVRVGPVGYAGDRREIAYLI